MQPTNSTAIVTRPSGATASALLTFTPEQRQLIRDSFANGATDSEFAVLMEVAQARGLNPLLRQIHFVQRWDTQKSRMVWAHQISIDGMRAVAQRTGLYDGQDEAEFVQAGAGLELCRVRVYRKDWARPAVGVAYWKEYVQTKKDGNVTAMWARMPHVMLAKCAEAIALRKAFPEDTSGLYVDEEMPEREVDGHAVTVAVSEPRPAQRRQPEVQKALPPASPAEVAPAPAAEEAKAAVREQLDKQGANHQAPPAPKPATAAPVSEANRQPGDDYPTDAERAEIEATDLLDAAQDLAGLKEAAKKAAPLKARMGEDGYARVKQHLADRTAKLAGKAMA